jgi:CDP-Glycerol:Poly(glycerophosphate) glycerophosphotransferase
MRWVAGRVLAPLVLLVGAAAGGVRCLGWGMRYLGWGHGRAATVIEKIGGTIWEEVNRFRQESKSKACDLSAFVKQQQASNPLPGNLPTVFLLITCGQAVRNFLLSDVLDLLKRKYNVVILTPHAYSDSFLRDYSMPGVHVLPWFESFRTISERAFQYYFMATSSSRTHRGWLANLDDRARNAKTRRSRYKKLALMRRLSQLLGSTVGRRGMQGLYASYFMAYLSKKPFDYLFSTYRPSLVISTTSHHAEAWPLTYFARRRGIKTLANVLSWDNTSTKTLMDISCDYTTVWSEEMQKEFVRQFPHIKTKVVVTGCPLFDIYYNKPLAQDRKTFLSEIGLDPEKPYILYTTNTPSAMEDESQIVAQYWKALQASPLAGKVGVLVRLHPKERFEKYRSLATAGYTDLAITTAARAYWDRSDRWLPNQRDMRLLLNSMLHAAVSVNIASTMSLESFALGLPTINIAFKPSEVDSSPSMWSFDMYHTSEHYHALVDNGAVDLAHSIEDLLSLTAKALADGATRREAMQLTLALKAAHCDGSAAIRFVEVVDQIVQPAKGNMAVRDGRPKRSPRVFSGLPPTAQPAE